MTSPGHSPGTAWQARGKQGPTAATRGLHALGQAAPLASQPTVMPREEARCRSPGPRTPSSLQSEGRPEQGVESDGGPLPRSGASLVSGGHVSRPPRPRANRWGEGARPLLPGTAPHPGVKTGVRGPIVETVVPVDCTPTHCAAPPDPGASAPHLEGGARTSWGSPLPSPVSRPPPPGAGLQGPALGSGSSRLHTILSPGSQTLHRLQGSQQPRTAGSVLGGEAGALPRVDEGSRTLSSCHAHHKSPASLGRFSNIKGNSLPETARGNSARPYTKVETPSIITSEKQVRKCKIHQREGRGSLHVWSQLKPKLRL